MHRPHRWHTPRKIRWLTYCLSCGLVKLNNPATARAVRAACPDYED